MAENIAVSPDEVKIKAFIGDLLFEDIISLSYNKTLDSISSALTLKLPFDSQFLPRNALDNKGINKFDFAEIYINDSKFFTGFVDSMSASFNKGNADITLKLNDLAGYLNYRMRLIEFEGGMLQLKELADSLQRDPGFPFKIEVDSSIAHLFVSVPSTKDLMEIFTEVKRKLPVHIYMDENGVMQIKAPQSILKGEVREAWIFKNGENINSISVNNLYSDINMIVATSYIDNELITGVAIDLIGLQLSGTLNYEVIEQNNIDNQVDLENFAANELLKRGKNYLVNISSPFVLGLQLGDGVQIKGFDELVNPDALFRIRTIDYSISKGSATMSIGCYLNALPDLPEEIVTGSYNVVQATYVSGGFV